MANWQATVDIKRFINDGDSDTANYQRCEKIAAALRSSPFVMKTYGGDELVEQFEDASKTYQLDGDDDAELLNDCLHDLYDWADRERVWLGL